MKLREELAGVSLYGALMTTALAAGWLLPNHYPPWNTFHNNAWIAGILLVAGLGVLSSNPASIRVSTVGAFLAAASVIPWIQHGAGLLPLPSDALLCFLYLLGFAGAFILGEHWNRTRPGRPASWILGAASLAAVISVGLQTYQWLGFTRGDGLQDIWVMSFSDGSRPYANLGQPNQLGSLLLWGLLGVGWAWHKRWVGKTTGLLLAAIILFGVALTESRTAMLTLTLGVALVSIRKFSFLDKPFVRTAQGLYLYYLACLFGHEQLGRLIGVDAPLTLFVRTGGELRFALWRMALDATMVNPWFGSGWGRANAGLLQVFLNHPQFADLYFDQSHNLFLDLVLWVGWPLALALTVCASLWLFRVVRSIASTEQLLTVAALGVMLIHAMLEFPLHYGYFLWPFGLLAGSATVGIHAKDVGALPRKVALTLLAALLALLGIIVHDYLACEESFTELRFQIARVGSGHNEKPPETILLTDWPKVIALARATPHAGMSAAEIQEWKDLLIYQTAPLGFRKVIGALMLNGRPEEARIWADRACWLLPKKSCSVLINEWQVPVQMSSPSATSDQK